MTQTIPLTPIQAEIHKALQAGKSRAEVARERGCAVANVYATARTIRAKGWSVPEARRGRKPTVGWPREGDKRQTSIVFDAETFGEIEAAAHRRGVTFSEQVRLLVEWGLEAERDDVG